eukprot:TRINITY_DN5587_c0_g2_i2.p1 TRINITY_DN5587_c0_g2~~TRINITY_DN5587_c0_g2_i2.p1  ORF type:complete len:270 (-),score=49.29 TRINITY_DN5587_c0_g2_i2:506-1315(-)
MKLLLLVLTLALALFLQPDLDMVTLFQGGQSSVPETQGGFVSDVEMQLRISLSEYNDQIEELRALLANTIDLQAALKKKTKISVPRRDASSMTVEEFFNEYALKSKPLVITGLKDIIFPEGQWSLKDIDYICGDREVVPLVKNPHANTWAGLIEDNRQISLANYIRYYSKAKQYTTTEQILYLHDWSLPLHCPQILGVSEKPSFVVPKYFKEDFFKKLQNNTLQFSSDWPSLFIGPQGSQSGLHVDSFGTNFWMFLMEGKRLFSFLLCS